MGKEALLGASFLISGTGEAPDNSTASDSSPTHPVRRTKKTRHSALYLVLLAPGCDNNGRSRNLLRELGLQGA